jgi:glutamate dehydrogenase
LRGGKVARGGLRWSDRHEDFRTEVLGLVKAQNTKNAVIVPVGSKGCFVVKKPITGLTREQILKDGIIAYQTFLFLPVNFLSDLLFPLSHVLRFD